MPIHISSATVAPTQYSTDATTFDVTLAVAGTAENAVVPPATKTGRRLSIVNEGPGIAYIKFDGTATILNGLALGKGDTYDDDNITVVTNVSFIGEVAKQPRVRGILWSN